MLDKIISGGQTGVDTAALDVAIALGVPHGGRCPKGRLRENGIIPLLYNLEETESSDYSERTKLNIHDSDGTIIFLPLNKTITDGTILTIQEAEKKNKPYLIIDCFEEEQSDRIKSWLEENNIRILNIAGPRESQAEGIYKQCYDFLYKILCTLQSGFLNTLKMR